MTNMVIVPSVLVRNESAFRAQIAAVHDLVPLVQIDIADGEFVPNVTWANPDVAREALGELPAELHLMVTRPLEVARGWARVRQINRVLVHCESKADLSAEIRELKGLGWEVGLVLNPETPIEAVKPYLPEVKTIQLMGIHTGFQGTPFIPETLERIRQTKLKYPDKFVQVDGGVNEKTLPDIVKAGADAVAPGSAIFGNARTPAENLARLKAVIQKSVER